MLKKILSAPHFIFSMIGFFYLPWHGRLPLYLSCGALLAVIFGVFSGANSLALGFVLLLIGEISNWAAEKEDTTHVRGNKLVSADTIKKMVKGEPANFCLGDVPIPAKFETRHFLFAGTTGSGKTRAFHQILQPTRATNARAIVVDIGGAMVSRYYQPGDVILNPRDQRTVDWSPLAEIETEDDIALVAKAIVPDGQGAQAEWNTYAQRLLTGVISQVMDAGGTTGDMIKILTTASHEELKTVVAGTATEGMFREGNERMVSGVLAILASYLTPFQTLNQAAGTDAFSVREWVRSGPEKSWLYLNFSDSQIESLKPIITSVLGISITALLSLREDPGRRLFFVIDEFDSLGAITGIKSLLTRGRRFGGSAIVAIQSVSQLHESYGRDVSNTICANLGTQLILRLPDPETAEWASKIFGDEQIIRAQESEGTSDGKTSTNTSYQHAQQRVVLASEIQNLPDLRGLLNIVGDIPPCPVNIPPINPPQLHPEQILKTSGRTFKKSAAAQQTA